MNRTTTIIALAIAAILGLGAFYYTSTGATSEQATMSTDDSTTETATDEAAADLPLVEEMTLGNADAPVQVFEYSSYTCPHCAAFHVESYDKLKADYIDTGKIHYTYREVYFDRIGLWASMIARCGGKDKFFGISDLIHKGQRDWLGDGDPVKIADGLRKIGRVAGLDAAAIDACLEDEASAQSLVAWFQKNGDEHGIESTPSFIVNGELIAGNNYTKLKEAIDAQLGN